MSTPPPVNKTESRAQDAGHEPTELARTIMEHIGSHGPMTFRWFMERALYAPGHGYYTGVRTAWSEQADFVTAPQVDASLGVAIARLARECDRALGSPSRFDLVEAGGGDGALLADTCDAIAVDSSQLYRRLRVTSIERGEAARAQQRRRLATHLEVVEWRESFESLDAGSFGGLVFSNELLDALPVHRVVCRDGRLRELFVDLSDEGRLVDREMEPSTSELEGYLRANDVNLQEGQVAEICLAIGPWIEAVARSLERGYVLTVDYGGSSRSLYESGRLDGTLVCQHRYQLNARPYERIGEQDITAHVDFGNLRRRGAACGLETLGTAGLAVFLLGFGAAERIVANAGDGDEDADAVRRRLGLRHLLFTEIADAHRAVLQVKDAPPIPFGVERLG